jgi:putative transposase
LKKAAAFFASESKTRVKVFGFVLARKAEHSIGLMCRVLEVSRSGYHAWAAREPSAGAVADAAPGVRIAAIHEGSLKT